MPEADAPPLSATRLPGDVPGRYVRVHAHLLERGRGHADVHAARWTATPDAPTDASVQVCVHGLGGSWLNWAAVAPLLAAAGPVWAPDLAGFGKTVPATRSASVPDNLDLLAGFVATVGAGRPVVLYGNSMGGHLAYSLAARRPELVEGLVLVGPAVPPVLRRPDPRVAARLALVATPVAGRVWLERAARRLTPAEQVRETLEICTREPDALDPALFEALVELNALRRRMPHAIPSYLTAARSLFRRLQPRRHGVWDDLAAVRAPTLVLQGARDRLVTVESVEQIIAYRPDWEYRVYPELGHLVMLEDPGRVAADVHAWRVRTGVGAGG